MEGQMAGYQYPLPFRADDTAFRTRVSLAQPMGPPLPLVSQGPQAEGTMRWAQYGAGEPGEVARVLLRRALNPKGGRMADRRKYRGRKVLDGELRLGAQAERRGTKRGKGQRASKGPNRNNRKAWRLKGEDRQGARGFVATEPGRVQLPLRPLNGVLPAAHTPHRPETGAGVCVVVTPHRTPSLHDVAELCVNPYGTMAGAIKLESVDRETEGQGEASGKGGGSSSTGPTSSGSEGRAEALPSWKLADGFGGPHLGTYHGRGTQGADSFMRARIEEQEVQLNHLEEENLTLKEKLFLVQQELEELRRRTLGILPAMEGGAEAGEAEGDNSAIWACMSTA